MSNHWWKQKQVLVIRVIDALEKTNRYWGVKKLREDRSSKQQRFKKKTQRLLNYKWGEANSTFSNFSEDLSHKNEDLKPDLDAVRRVLKAKKKRREREKTHRKTTENENDRVVSSFLSSFSVKTHIPTAEISTTEQLTAKCLNITAYK